MKQTWLRILSITPGVVCLLVMGACQSSRTQGKAELTVLAAASLTEAFSRIGAEFEAENSGLKVQISFASSQQLAAQLSQGAPADVYASADRAKMDLAVSSGRIAPDQVKGFAHNRLVVVVSAQKRPSIQTLQDLSLPGLRLLVATPETPVGAYSVQFLNAASQDPFFGLGYREAVLENVISFEPDVKAVYRKVALGEADAGIVYASDAAGAGSGQLGVIEIPEHLNQQAVYVIAPVSDSRQPAQAQQFVTFVLSDRGQAILGEYGFLP